MRDAMGKVSCTLIVLNVFTFFILFHTFLNNNAKTIELKRNAESAGGVWKRCKCNCKPVYRVIEVQSPCNVSADRLHENTVNSRLSEQNENISFSRKDKYKNVSETTQMLRLKLLLVDLAKNINVAKQHVRGVKTSEALTKAKQNMIQTLQVVGLSWNNVTKRITRRSKSVCPEIFMGEGYGYPLYQTGWSVTNCTNSKPLHTLISIVTVFKSNDIVQLYELISSTMHYNSQLPMFISVPKRISAGVEKSFLKGYRNLRFTTHSENKYEGVIWNNLISDVTTPYVLVARNLVWMDSDVRLERLIGQIERLDVVTAGGATRDGQGHWSLGCHQRALRNYTLVYEAGYDISYEECIFCDHIDSPFVIKTNVAKRFILHSKLKGQGLFEEYFVRLNQAEHIVCPDSMFYVQISERNLQPSDWESLGNILDIQRIVYSGKEINLRCPNYGTHKYPCDGNTTARSICCMKELSQLVVTAMDMCANSSIICELESGTLLSAVKLHSSFPWEVDADTFFLSNNYTKLKNTKQKFQKLGYELIVERPENALKCCIGKEKRFYDGYFALWSLDKNFRLEFNGIPFLSSESHFMNGKSPTLLQYNGKWVRGPRNPGLVARNCYGSELFQHSQHWSNTGEIDYFKRFKQCQYKGHHACLDQFNADGNLQFRDPIP